MLLVGAVVVAVGAYQANARRAIALARAGGAAASSADAIPLITLPDDSNSVAMRMGKVAQRWLPEGAVALDTSSQLIQAGFESPAAPVLYTMTRLVSALIIPGALFAWGPHDSSFMVLLSGAIGIALGLVAPPALLERMRRLRQERIIRSIPDTLDLLLVCVEAGVSLDALLLRVAIRERERTHPPAQLLCRRRHDPQIIGGSRTPLGHRQPGDDRRDKFQIQRARLRVRLEVCTPRLRFDQEQHAAHRQEQ